jgi:predicted transposase YdaD
MPSTAASKHFIDELYRHVFAKFGEANEMETLFKTKWEIRTEEALEKARQEGWRAGQQEGRHAGQQEGKQEGRQEAREAMVRSAVKSGLPLPEIAKLLDLDLAEVQRIAAQS